MATEQDSAPTDVSQASTTAGAVFLSYASEDAAAAERIAAALRAGGIEVWFDKSELRGGDIWDRQIREQIHDCRLFIAVISAHTEARDEGYFRREWRLAVERAGDMAEDKAFLVPVAIDGTSERSARVPDSFKHVQWTRLRDGTAMPAFVGLIKKLLATPSPVGDSPNVHDSSQPGAPVRELAFPRGLKISRPWFVSILVACAFAIAAAAYVSVNRFSHRNAETTTTSVTVTPAAMDKSIAVLPFADLSEKHDQEYFTDGMAEEILNLLVKIPELKVIGRTSSFSFKRKQTDLPSIGRALGVAYLVEGSIRRVNDHIRVTAQLIDARDGSHRWADTLEGTTSDTFRLQEEIAVRVAHSLNVEVAERLPTRTTLKSPEAYDYYLRGLHELDENSSESTDVAREYFQKALSLAPDFAPAAVEIAEADSYRCLNGTKTDVSCPWALSSVDAALKLDPRSADAYAIRAQLLIGYKWDWTGAGAAVSKATQFGGSLKTNFAAARLAYAICDMTRARELLRSIAASNPFDPAAKIDMGFFVELRSGHFQEAESWMRRGLQIAPGYATGLYLLGVTQLVQGKLDDALASMKAEKLDEGQLGGLALVYSAMGRKLDFDAALVAMEQNGNYLPSDFARAYAVHGDLDRALEYLEKAYRTHDVFLWYIKNDPLLKNLETDRRYKAFLRKMNLPE